MSDATDEALLETQRAKLEAETRAAEAEAVRNAALARKHEAEARGTETAALVAELQLRELQREESKLLARDDHHHVYQFTSSVSESSVKACIAKLSEWHRLEPRCDIEIVFNSPGGDVFAGLHLCDVIEELGESGHRITTRIAGLAASMAGVLAQVGAHRVIGRNSLLHLHEVSTGAIGKASDIEDTAELAKRLTMQICEIYARRGKKSAKQLYRLIERHEVYLSAEEAKAEGLVDEIR